MPVTIMIMRHAEKPAAEDKPPFGVTYDGERDSKSLSVRGWIRAGALIGLFASDSKVTSESALSVPDLIYASGPAGPSKRPLQTIMPLAAKLGLEPNISFTKNDEEALAADVLRTSGNVLISWQHERISVIVSHLMAGAATTLAVPETWPSDRYDVIWVLTRTDNPATPWRFSQIPQRLLAGDRANPI